jgi:hypothetical protein
MGEPHHRLGKLFGALGEASARPAALSAIDATIAESGLSWGEISAAFDRGAPGAPGEPSQREALLLRMAREKLSICLAEPAALKIAEAETIGRIAAAVEAGEHLPAADIAALLNISELVRRRAPGRR